jgi:hypothetical protein
MSATTTSAIRRHDRQCLRRGPCRLRPLARVESLVDHHETWIALFAPGAEAASAGVTSTAWSYPLRPVS